jgi:aliphatic nitrilase
VRVAAVQAAPVFLDRERTVEKACLLIREAGSNGARLIAFPENFIPGHPYWFAFHPVASRVSMGFSKALFLNAVPVPGAATDLLAVAARESGAYVVMGLTQKAPDATGTMYNAQLFIAPDGAILGLRQKLVPTVGERIVHAPGGGDGIRTFPTEFGPISGLVCAENSNPLATYAMLAMGTRIHVAGWPSFFQRGFDMQEQMEISARAIAQQNACFVVNVCSAVDDALVDQLPATDDDRAFIQEEAAKGGSAIYAPGGRLLAGPAPGGETILYADVDLDQIVQRKLVKDYAGHYNRFDVFELRVRRSAQGQPIVIEAAASDESFATAVESDSVVD